MLIAVSLPTTRAVFAVHVLLLCSSRLATGALSDDAPGGMTSCDAIKAGGSITDDDASFRSTATGLVAFNAPPEAVRLALAVAVVPGVSGDGGGDSSSSLSASTTSMEDNLHEHRLQRDFRSAAVAADADAAACDDDDDDDVARLRL